MMVRLLAPKGCTSCSFGGDEFAVADGVVDVPPEAVGELLLHGFAVAEDQAQSKQKGKKNAE